MNVSYIFYIFMSKCLFFLVYFNDNIDAVY